ncbi:hypothetical protein SD70_24925 [Gordoniibacillus kamchatkensis]|uniref:Uncharacterized protein n=1 Tax=Gordoniibacillus kamchatkensis TaxID=1590651 RepID=A0ABR5ACY6_9BACL|nr:hypothetical protein SD70_24925 [Paenibacillus sp. VKM B-2647]
MKIGLKSYVTSFFKAKSTKRWVFGIEAKETDSITNSFEYRLYTEQKNALSCGGLITIIDY